MSRFLKYHLKSFLIFGVIFYLLYQNFHLEKQLYELAKYMSIVLSGALGDISAQINH